MAKLVIKAIEFIAWNPNRYIGAFFTSHPATSLIGDRDLLLVFLLVVDRMS